MSMCLERPLHRRYTARALKHNTFFFLISTVCCQAARARYFTAVQHARAFRGGGRDAETRGGGARRPRGVPRTPHGAGNRTRKAFAVLNILSHKREGNSRAKAPPHGESRPWLRLAMLTGGRTAACFPE